MKKAILPVLVATFLLAGASCTPAGGTSPSGLAVRAIKVDGHPLTVEVADTPASRTTGLMFREDLPEDRGMIFVFPAASPLSFWMKNTLVPLSIAFIDAGGRIFQIEDMEPRSLRSIPSKEAAKYALEVRQGWFQRRGIGVGDPVAGIEGLEASQ